MLQYDHAETDTEIVPATHKAYIQSITLAKGATGTNALTMVLEEAGGSTTVYSAGVASGAPYDSLYIDFGGHEPGFNGLQITTTGNAGDFVYIQALQRIE